MSKEYDFQANAQPQRVQQPGFVQPQPPQPFYPGPYQQALAPQAQQFPVQQMQPMQTLQPMQPMQPMQPPQQGQAQSWAPAPAQAWGGFAPQGQAAGHNSQMNQQATHVGPLPQPPQQAQTKSTLEHAPRAIVDNENALEVRLLWGDTVLDHAHYRTEAKRITIGESRQNTFTLSSEALPKGEESFTIVDIAEDEGAIYINYTDAMQGWLTYQGQQQTFAKLQAEGHTHRTQDGQRLVLPEKGKISLQVGSLMFEIGVVPVPAKLGVVGNMVVDHKLSRALGASFLLHGLVVIFMLFSDETPRNLDETFMKQNDRFAGLIVRPQEPEKKTATKKRSGGGKAHKKEGKMGDKKSTKRNRRADQIKKNPDGTSPIDLKKSINKDQLVKSIMRKGFLGLLPGGKQAAGSVLSAKGLGGGDSDSLGTWRGAKSGNAFGGGGLGLKGAGGPGGGGLMGNSVALGRPGLFGRGDGKGGRNWGRGKLRKRSKHIVKVVACVKCIQAYGGLDRKIIRRHINMRRRHIKYCYERELIKNKRLGGKVEIKFTIEANGRVHKAEVARSTMNNDRVEECIRRQVTYIRFPSPVGGGIVVVRYPFMFRSGGQ